jgi:hypothetical protein
MDETQSLAERANEDLFDLSLIGTRILEPSKSMSTEPSHESSRNAARSRFKGALSQSGLDLSWIEPLSETFASLEQEANEQQLDPLRGATAEDIAQHLI